MSAFGAKSAAKTSGAARHYFLIGTASSWRTRNTSDGQRTCDFCRDRQLRSGDATNLEFPLFLLQTNRALAEDITTGARFVLSRPRSLTNWQRKALILPRCSPALIMKRAANRLGF